MKVVINKCFGGFGLSHKAVMRYAEIKGITLFPFVDARSKTGMLEFDRHVPYIEGDDAFIIYYSTKPLTADGKYEKGSYFSESEIARNDIDLVKVVKELGEKANGSCAALEIIEIPDDIQWEIDEYDGMESISEQYRSWG